MLQHRLGWNGSFGLSGRLGAQLFLWENGQVLHGQAEGGEAYTDDHSRDRQFTPLGEITNASRAFKSSYADIHPIGDEAQHHRHCGEIQPGRAVPHPLLYQQHQRQDDRQHDLKPEEVRFVSRVERHFECPAIGEIFKA
jgi:hypothetical protein